MLTQAPSFHSHINWQNIGLLLQQDGKELLAYAIRLAGAFRLEAAHAKLPQDQAMASVAAQADRVQPSSIPGSIYSPHPGWNCPAIYGNLCDLANSHLPIQPGWRGSRREIDRQHQSQIAAGSPRGYQYQGVPDTPRQKASPQPAAGTPPLRA